LLLCESRNLLGGANASGAVGAGAVANGAVGAGTGSSASAVNLAGICTLALAALVAAAGSERNSHYSGENQCNLFHFSAFFYTVKQSFCSKTATKVRHFGETTIRENKKISFILLFFIPL
jgi:hypothetical protein